MNTLCILVAQFNIFLELINRNTWRRVSSWTINTTWKEQCIWLTLLYKLGIGETKFSSFALMETILSHVFRCTLRRRKCCRCEYTVFLHPIYSSSQNSMQTKIIYDLDISLILQNLTMVRLWILTLLLCSVNLIRLRIWLVLVLENAGKPIWRDGGLNYQ